MKNEEKLHIEDWLAFWFALVGMIFVLILFFYRIIMYGIWKFLLYWLVMFIFATRLEEIICTWRFYDRETKKEDVKENLLYFTSFVIMGIFLFVFCDWALEFSFAFLINEQ